MKISYFQKDKNEEIKWDNITRDERYFCSELFHNLRSDQSGILSLIKESIITEEKKDKEKLNFLKNIESKRFDIGFEVCFYRDMLNYYGVRIKWQMEKLKEHSLSFKRTFDLALFSEDAIIIIEAKAQQGFDTKQLKEFKKDRKRIKKLFKKINRNKPKVFIVGLYSSKYSPNSETIKSFDSIIKWSDIAQKYPSSKDIFIRANDIYPNKNDSKESNPV